DSIPPTDSDALPAVSGSAALADSPDSHDAADAGVSAPRERRPSWTKWPQRFRRGGQGRTANGDAERRDRRWTAPLETGEIYLIEQLSELLRHGIDRPQFYGHPAGALLMYRSQLTESAAAMLYNAVFKDAPDRSEELEDSIARVISVEPVYSEKEATVDKIGWWYEALGIESDNSRQNELVGALDTWLRQRLMTALELLRLGDFAWYLASPSRTFEVIVDGDSFNADQVRALRAGAVARYLERLRIGLWRDGRDEPDSVTIVEDALADVEAFDAKLDQLSRTNQTKPFTRDQLNSVGVLLRDAYGRS
ncbi:MAG: hypothetical protein HKN91_01090, partial [Acidimicrobiia bacterium]|nr:hypothetical protein [Acidimicrobiia bacterium]